jgi:hypothetical protein
MTRTLLALLPACLLSACATSTDCGSDWAAVGERDGRINAGSQAERYAAKCSAPVDRARYEEGYQRGFSQRRGPFV